MRVWGRVYTVPDDPSQGYQWVAVDTLAGDQQDYVYITWLIQVLKLNLNESPVYSDWGIPALPSVISQIAPDYYVTLTQQRFSQFFASLQITKTADDPPTYRINLTTLQGVTLALTIPT